MQIKQEKDRQKKGAALMKTVSQARKAMASINMLADAMTLSLIHISEPTRPY